MAPEYLIRGQLTDKADVYSFGVLVLEVVTGRRNNVFREDSGSLLQTVRFVFLTCTKIETTFFIFWATGFNTFYLELL